MSRLDTYLEHGKAEAEHPAQQPVVDQQHKQGEGQGQQELGVTEYIVYTFYTYVCTVCTVHLASGYVFCTDVCFSH